MTNFDLDLLVDMLAYKRPAGSYTEILFIDKFILTLPGSYQDGFGNVIVDIGDSPDIIFSCHTDTVDITSGYRHVLRFDDLSTISSSGGDILGADDCLGVFIMREMILAGVSGRYIFHREEETMCVGSEWILANTPELLAGVKAAIAFDRAGDYDVIDHMWCGRTASPGFINDLCVLLGENYAPATGSITDTATYSNVIENCTNISVGYFNQHTEFEWVDIERFEIILTKALTVDWGSLVR